MMMFFYTLAWALGGLLGGYFGLRLGFRHISSKARELKKEITVSIKSEIKDSLENGEFDETFVKIADGLIETLKNKFFGDTGPLKQKQKGLQGAVMTDVITKLHPAAGPLLDMLPEVKRYIKKNPDTVMSFIPLLQNMLKGGQQNGQIAQVSPLQGDASYQTQFPAMQK